MRRKNNPCIKFLLIILFCMLIALSFFSASLLSFADDPNELTVGVPTDRCPVFYQEEDTGEIVGIGADLLLMAAEKAGY